MVLFKKNILAEFPFIKSILILIITTIIFLTYVILLSTNSISIDDKKVKTQIIIKRIFESDCFSNQYGILDPKKLTENSINSCFSGFKKVSGDIIISSSKFSKSFYIGSEENFKIKSSLCSLNSPSVLCSKLIYPILINIDGINYLSNLKLYLILEN